MIFFSTLLVAGLVPFQPPPPLAVPPESAPPAAKPPTTRPNSSDIELVERLVEARRAHAAALKNLYDYYRKVGDAQRARWAEDELKQFHRLPHYAYRLDLDLPSPRLQPLYNISGANDLYRDALRYKDRGLGTDYIDNQKRAELLLQQLLTDYPQSNKISDAAFALGDIYESRAFHHYERAAAYYERCFQWDPRTPTDARLRAARLYDRELKNRRRAVELYRQVLDNETEPGRLQEARRRLADLTGP
jgi:TolA-binding protein